MWHDVWVHDTGSDAAPVADPAAARLKAAAAAQLAADQAQAALALARKEADARRKALALAMSSAEGDAAKAREAAKLNAAEAIKASEAARLAAEEEAAAAKRAALPSFSDMMESRTNWQDSGDSVDPEGAKVAAAEGNKFLRAHEFDAACKAYDKAIELDSTNAMFFSNRAAVYLQMTGTENLALAVADCERATTLNPKYIKAFSRLGLAYTKQGEFKLAIERGYSKALLLDPSNQVAQKELDKVRTMLVQDAADGPLKAAAAAAAAAEEAIALAEAKVAEAVKVALTAAEDAAAPVPTNAHAADSAASVVGTKAHRQQQEQLGAADKEMAVGTYIHVEGHGDGTYEGFKATWMGANEHTIRFVGDNVQVLRLKELTWNVVGAHAVGGPSDSTLCEVLKRSDSTQTGPATHLILLDWSVSFREAVVAIHNSLATFQGKPYVWIDAMCLAVASPDNRLQRIRDPRWLDDLHAAISVIGRVVQVCSAWDEPNGPDNWSTFVSAAAIASGATLAYALTPAEQHNAVKAVASAGASSIIERAGQYKPTVTAEGTSEEGTASEAVLLQDKITALLAPLASQSESDLSMPLKKLTCKAYAGILEREFQTKLPQQEWAVTGEGGLAKNCESLLTVGYSVGELWSTGDEIPRASEIFRQVLAQLPSAEQVAETEEWVGTLRDQVATALESLGPRGLQQSMAAFEADFNFDAPDDGCFLGSVVITMLEQLRDLSQADAAEMQSLTTDRSEPPTSALWIKSWVDTSRAEVRAAEREATIHQGISLLANIAKRCISFLQAAQSDLQQQREDAVVKRDKAMALEKVCREKLAVMEKLVASEKEARKELKQLKRTDRADTRTRFRIAACKNRMDEAELMEDMSSDSDSDQSDLEDEFATGDWTREMLDAKLVELTGLRAELADKRTETVATLQSMISILPELRLNPRMTAEAK